MYVIEFNCHLEPRELSFTVPFYVFVFFKKCLFMYLERERESMSRGAAERGGKRESQAGSALSAQSPVWCSIPHAMRS